MEPVRATLEADLAVAPLLSHSVPESLDIIESRPAAAEAADVPHQSLSSRQR